MRVVHVKPEGWADTEEAGVIQPSHVAGMVHQVELEEGDLVQGPKGEPGPKGAPGPNVAGMVAFFARASAPAGWLVCDGSLVSRAAYPALFAAIGVVFGAGDGVSTFKLPDLRGEFVRGWDGGRGVDTGRAMGSAQAQATKGPGMSNALSNSPWNIGTNSVTGLCDNTTTATETRPRNVALLPCIAVGV